MERNGTDGNGHSHREAPKPYSSHLLVPAKIGIVGYGVVGNAIARGFEIMSGGADQIIYHDKDPKKVHRRPLREVAERSDIIFITLPTPMRDDSAESPDSGIDLSIIDETIDRISTYTDNSDKIVAIKSTVIPGTTEGYERRYPGTNFAFNPEFLTEKTPIRDFLNAPETFVGANRDLVGRTLASFYEQRYLHLRAHAVERMSPTTAEMAKMFRNNFLEIKVLFGNKFFEYCQAKGVDYFEMKKYASRDPRIVDSHFDIHEKQTPEGISRGVGGKCLSKDPVSTIADMLRVGVDPSFLQEAWRYNLRINLARDWRDIPGAVSSNSSFDGPSESTQAPV